MYNWVICRGFLAQTILMFVKNVITIEEVHYFVIHDPLKYFRKCWEKADGSVVFKFGGIRNFKYWNCLSYFQLRIYACQWLFLKNIYWSYLLFQFRLKYICCWFGKSGTIFIYQFVYLYLVLLPIRIFFILFGFNSRRWE